MIDVSDGVLQDLGHLCEASGVGAAIEAPSLPLSLEYRTILGEREWTLALTGGEDYELLFTAPAGRQAEVAVIAERGQCRVTRIGRIVSHAEGIRVYDPDGKIYTPVQTGYDHFRQA
jgi:thiamine-monophosphate kinase